MAVVNVSNIARHGIVSDEPDHMQPPEAWTHAINVRFSESRAYSFSGEVEIMDPPTVPPAHVTYMPTPGGPFWFYASAIGAGSKIYGHAAGVHVDMSKVGNYAASTPDEWNSTFFQGIPIMNCGAGAPQYLPTISTADDFEDLLNWTPNEEAKVVRSYKNYLVALNTNNLTDDRPHRVHVSDSAEPGFLPTSWDVDDPAVDALEFDLSDVNAGDILDGMTLRDMFIIYKGESTWIMRHIGGQLIMGFDTILQTAGILTTRCVTPVFLSVAKVQAHFLHNGQDVGLFNGQDFESVINKKVRKYLNSVIDPQFYTLSYVVDNPAQDEVWFCYPEIGMEFPNMALVWNYRSNTITFRENQAVHAATGIVEDQSLLTWDSVDPALSWDGSYPLQWAAAAKRRLVQADQINTHLLQADSGNDFNGTPFTSVVERTGLAIIGQDREGAPLLDYQQRRLMGRIWPKVIGSPINVFYGGQDKIGGTITYALPVVYDPASPLNFVDPEQPLNVRLPAIKFESIGGQPFSIEGYDIDIQPLGDN